MKHYKAIVTRTSTAIIEFDEDEIEEGDTPQDAAEALAECIPDRDWEVDTEEVELDEQN